VIGAPLVWSGTAFERGLAQANAALREQVRRATVARVEQARADGLLDAEAIAYLAAQRRFMSENDPEGMAELRGIAQGFDLPEPELFTHLHLGTLRDIKGGATLVDGCSAWAVADGPDGPLVVKNRDYSGLHLGVQCIAEHRGADIAGEAMLCLGSLGSPGAYSSGMNARGLALADTQVAVATHRVGWLRYFLMTRILARCANVAEAIEFIRAIPHAGGGTLVMADTSGAIATVELGAQSVSVELSSHAPVWRTNHYISPELQDQTLLPKGDIISDNSQTRFSLLQNRLDRQSWSIKQAKLLMATHPDAGAPVCQHGEDDAAQTISSVVYSCRLGEMAFCEGNPCIGLWQHFHLPS